MKVQARTKDKPTPIEVNADIPEGVEALTKKFGIDVVAAAAKAQVVISLQAFMRRLIEKGKTVAEIQAEVDKWKPDVRTVVKMSPFERAAASLDKLSDEERKNLLKKLQEATKAPAKA